MRYLSPTPALAGLAAKSRGLLLQMSDDLIQRLVPRYPDRGLTVEECRGWPFDPAAGGWQGLQYLLGKGVTLAFLGNLLYDLESVSNYRFALPASDLAARSTVLPKLGNITIRELGG